MPRWPGSPDFFFTLGDVLLDFAVAHAASAPARCCRRSSRAGCARSRSASSRELNDTVRGRGSFLAAHNLAAFYEGQGDAAKARHWRERAGAMRAGVPAGAAHAPARRADRRRELAAGAAAISAHRRRRAAYAVVHAFLSRRRRVAGRDRRPWPCSFPLPPRPAPRAAHARAHKLLAGRPVARRARALAARRASVRAGGGAAWRRRLCAWRRRTR